VSVSVYHLNEETEMRFNDLSFSKQLLAWICSGLHIYVMSRSFVAMI